MRKTVGLLVLLLLVSAGSIQPAHATGSSPSHTDAACIAACFACGFTAFLGPTCDTWIECLDQRSYAANTSAENDQKAASAWLTNVANCATDPADIDTCIASNTAATSPGRDWTASFDDGTGILSVTNTGGSPDTAIVFAFAQEAGSVPLLAADAVASNVPSGNTVNIDLSGGLLPSGRTLHFVVASGSGPADNGDGFGTATFAVAPNAVPAMSTTQMVVLGLLILGGAIFLILRM